MQSCKGSQQHPSQHDDMIRIMLTSRSYASHDASSVVGAGMSNVIVSVEQAGGVTHSWSDMLALQNVHSYQGTCMQTWISNKSRFPQVMRFRRCACFHG
jgi:hypothetical protein